MVSIVGSPLVTHFSNSIFCQSKFLDHVAIDQMLLDDPFQHGRCTRVIPNTFRINYGDRSLRAYAQAIGLGPVHQRFRTCELQFLQAPFQIFPGFEAFLFGRAFWFGLVGAQKNMAFVFLQPQCSSYGFEVVGHGLNDGGVFRRSAMQKSPGSAGISAGVSRTLELAGRDAGAPRNDH